MDLTMDALAELLNGREYGNEITAEEESAAKAAGLLVVFGASDDLVELRGVIHDEISSYDGVRFRFHGDRVVYNPYDEDLDVQNALRRLRMMEPAEDAWIGCPEVRAKWDENGYSWFVESDEPFAAFDVLECGEKFCRGIVVDVAKAMEPKPWMKKETE